MYDNDIEVVKVDAISPVDSRIRILETLSNTIAELDKKYRKGRIESVKNEKIRVEYARAIIYACKVSNDILKDIELSDAVYLLNQIKDGIGNTGSCEVPGIDNNKLDSVEHILKMLEKE